jgi:hypothetical protein
MKILIVVLGILLVILLVWTISALPVKQSDGKQVNLQLLALSERLLYNVKRDEPVDSVENSLTKYKVRDLQQGLVDDDARKVFWINLYNAWYQIFAIRDKKTKDFIYTDKDIRFADASLSLDDIEHGILRKFRWKYSLGYLPQFLPSKTIKQLAVKDLDFRIHFALNCGAKSCPPIAFYEYEKLNEQLDLSTRAFLENEAIIDEAKREVHVTKIMQWFRGDFGGGAGIKKVLLKYLEKDFLSYRVKFRNYDWREDLKNFSPAEPVK